MSLAENQWNQALTDLIDVSIIPSSRKRRVLERIKTHYRGIAQSGSALALGARCREFKSLYPDQFHWFTQCGSIVRIHKIS